MTPSPPATEHTFGVHLSSWKENQDTPWGRLRYTVALANIRRHLDDGPLRVLDAGGGDGRDAIPLAAEGHRLTLVDFSADMVAEARRSAEARGLADRMAFHQAPLSAIPSLFAPAAFDLVLCHSVLHYLEDVGGAVRGLCEVLRPHGLLSVLSLNRYAEAYRRALLLLDPVGALAALDTDTFANPRFGGVAMRTSTADDCVRVLAAAGCSVVGQYGVRCVCDYMPNTDVKRDPTFFSHLERLELTMSDRYPYYLLAKFFQVIARKEQRR